MLANHLVRLACERHLEDLASGASRGLRFDVQAAQHAIAFFGFLRHSKGEWAGETFVLAPWQAFVVGSLFGWQRTDGLRRFRTAYCAVPRKNGKSTLSAGIALYLLVADGEQGAEVYSAATTRDQARIVFDEAKRMVGSSPALRRRVQVLINNLNVEVSASRFMPLSSDAPSLVSAALRAGAQHHRLFGFLAIQGRWAGETFVWPPGRPSWSAPCSAGSAPMACGASAPPTAPCRARTARAPSRPASPSTCWSPTASRVPRSTPPPPPATRPASCSTRPSAWSVPPLPSGAGSRC